MPRLFVANVPFSLSNDDFIELMSSFGLKPRSAHLVLDPDGKSKGFGFAEMVTTSEADGLLAAANGAVIAGRPLRVEHAKQRARKEEHGNKEQGHERGR